MTEEQIAKARSRIGKRMGYPDTSLGRLLTRIDKAFDEGKPKNLIEILEEKFGPLEEDEID